MLIELLVTYAALQRASHPAVPQSAYILCQSLAPEFQACRVFWFSNSDRGDLKRSRLTFRARKRACTVDFANQLVLIFLEWFCGTNPRVGTLSIK
jgi:hypothetical protein